MSIWRTPVSGISTDWPAASSAAAPELSEAYSLVGIGIGINGMEFGCGKATGSEDRDANHVSKGIRA